MFFEGDFRSFLLGDADFAAAIGSRLYMGKLPKGTGYPAAVFRVVSEVPVGDHDMRGETLAVRRVQVDLYSDSGDVALEARRALMSFVNGAEGSQGDTVFQEISWENSYVTDEKALEVYRATVDLMVTSYALYAVTLSEIEWASLPSPDFFEGSNVELDTPNSFRKTNDDSDGFADAVVATDVAYVGAMALSWRPREGTENYCSGMLYPVNDELPLPLSTHGRPVVFAGSVSDGVKELRGSYDNAEGEAQSFDLEMDWDDSSVFKIEYYGGQVVFYHNGEIVHSGATARGQRLYGILLASHHDEGARDISFRPF